MGMRLGRLVFADSSWRGVSEAVPLGSKLVSLRERGGAVAGAGGGVLVIFLIVMALLAGALIRSRVLFCWRRYSSFSALLVSVMLLRIDVVVVVVVGGGGCWSCFRRLLEELRSCGR